MAERTKRCARCQTVKPWSDYHVKVRWDDGSTRRVQSYCRPCDAQNWREFAARQPEHVAELRRRSTERLKRNPEWAAQRRDYVREWARRHRGSRPDRYRYNPVTSVHGGPTVPAPPFAAWLATLGSSPAVIARATELNERRIHAVMKGEQGRVELDTVDRALLAVGDGTTLEDLYETEELAA